MGIVHRLLIFLNAKYINLKTASSFGNKERFLLTFRQRTLTERALDRFHAHKMIKRWAEEAGLPRGIICYTFRATGVTAYLENGGTVEHAQQIAAHE